MNSLATRRKQLEELADKLRVGSQASVKVEGTDDVACIGLLARLLGIDVWVALNPDADLPTFDKKAY
jgi:hypothetical protein